MIHRYVSAAQVEFENARDDYDSKQPGLGERFVGAVEDAARLICRHPTIAAQVIPGVRFERVKKFPYLLYYRVEADEVLIVAVAHERRRFGYWKKRLRNV